MNFTLKQLRYIEAAGRLGSIARAAEEMNISQSSITAAIDALEQGLDYDIFVRTPAKGIQATPSGAETLTLIRSFIDQSRHFETEMQSVGGDAAGLVRIACYATAAPSFLPPILQAITEEFPGISIKLLEGNMDRITEFLFDGEADLVFTYEETIDQRQHFEPLFEAPAYALISVRDPLAAQDSVSMAQLAERPMVLLDLPRTREYFISMFTDKGLDANVAHTTRSSEICRTLVASGFGYSILNIHPPEHLGADAPYRAVAIRDGGAAPVFGIATLAGARPPKTVRAFLDSCLRLSAANAFSGITVPLPAS
ncbi:LysR family transcriptional regulator [Alisedimentitalea sp. MJ-SS2]|uniref:LysR family transcriptional regulator n=1 Tax=Aliisedimentitalea sp. MJ-SS2 TaxID=3049795 RepID=UPI00290BF067|nr:LysR family transcriptional regulator [Alisedimentitalea sp. MJ-SS2]MDU8925858.1 LysR family transcriptional regulator [Alisedimentitalea sp. MJ-SS2]